MTYIGSSYILNQNKNLRESILLAAYETYEGTISRTLSVNVRPFVHVMNQRNMSSAKHCKHRGHENKIGVFSCSAKTDDFDESKISFTV